MIQQQKQEKTYQMINNFIQYSQYLQVMREKILNWAKERNLLDASNRNKQFIKLIEEIGELAQGMAKNDIVQIIDSIGDVQVVLIILAELYNLDSDKCLESAYETIKNRKGKTVNGIFIKDESNT
jgi:NTP pyrophosphatase (non-canonical NTP hydrolase)